ncbi:axial regulator YABBY 5 isoform X2 [Cryptomeria japonica]|uniref:axial regulator YABBY 5 isoform X2 n=1 Tax=Cryptomeria japonica TaxID=3369 RepID=UPI0027DA2BCE|nr:axial regulator YABBY 5 isoform X2 [Cryptomeria japonica]
MSSCNGHLCYVQCKHCNTLLAVNVPPSSLLQTTPVRCGHCTGLLSVNLAGLFQPLSNQQKEVVNCSFENREQSPSSSTTTHGGGVEPETSRFVSMVPEKRQRTPSAYNCFIREEIQRIKAINPDISHREAFGTAAKNWAYLGLMLTNTNKEVNPNQAEFEDQDPSQNANVL